MFRARGLLATAAGKIPRPPQTGLSRPTLVLAMASVAAVTRPKVDLLEFSRISIEVRYALLFLFLGVQGFHSPL